MVLLYKILTFPHYLRKRQEEKQAKRRAHWKRHLAFMYKLGLVDKDMVWKYGAMDW